MILDQSDDPDFAVVQAGGDSSGQHNVFSVLLTAIHSQASRVLRI